MSHLPVIAVDGPVASGKTTLTRRLAERCRLPFLDTGLLYRATARRLIEEGARSDRGAALDIAARLTLADTERSDLRAQGVGALASEIAAMPELRDALMPFQRAFCAQPGGGALCGRDTTSVICPEAAVKLYVDASAETRARRRLAELRGRGDDAKYEDVLDEVRRRDQRDRNRAIAPLLVADGSVVIDTTRLSADAVLAEALAVVRDRAPELAARAA